MAKADLDESQMTNGWRRGRFAGPGGADIY
jgi:hypothetical protein